MSGWGSPKSAAGSPKSAADVNVGGRSPRAVGNREQDRTSRRLGLTHSLTSPRTPEPKPELPSRPQVPVTGDDLPRPRSLSPPPRRTLAPPSVTGSALSAKLERASFVRASNAPAAPAAPPTPKTRARFSSRRGELDDIGADLDAAGAAGGGADNDDNGGTGAGACVDVPAPTPSGDVEEPMTPTPTSGGRGGGGRGGGGSSNSRVAALALAIESRRQEQEQRPQNDETPVMTLPAVITAAEAAGLAAEKRMRDSRNQHQHQYQRTEQFAPEEEEPVAAIATDTDTDTAAAAAPAVGVGMGVKRVGRVRGRGVVATQQDESIGSRSVTSSSDYGMAGTATSAYGTDMKSQIQASPQYWVAKKLGRSPVIKNKSASFSPAAPSPSSRPRW